LQGDESDYEGGDGDESDGDESEGSDEEDRELDEAAFLLADEEADATG